MSELSRRIMQLKVIIKYVIVLLYCKITKKKITNVWLISERGNDARDNGYVFYKYLKENHPEINVKFIIKKKSVDATKIDSRDIVKYQSFKHIKMFITSKYLISTHIQGTSPDFRSFMKLANKGLVKPYGKQIMLQHGITKDIVEIMLKKNNPYLKLFVCGAVPEYEYILSKYGYDRSVVKLTGFARYDKLCSKTKKQILLMPTWRDYLYKYNEKDFLESEYYKKYNEFLNNAELNSFLESKGYTLVFYPHYEIQKYIHCFNTENKNIIIADFNNYDVQELLNESCILITDYSSVFFDFAYMNKPVIYFQFDYEIYRNTQYKEGYFNYKNNGFGEIYNNIEGLVEKLKEYDETNIIVEKKFKDRIDKFFPYKDNDNCERIFKEILNLCN